MYLFNHFFFYSLLMHEICSFLLRLANSKLLILVMSRFQCSSDTKLVIRQLVQRYAAVLKDGVEDLPPEALPDIDAAVVDPLQQAIQLTKFAFLNPPKYFFVSSLKDIPFHCMRYDLLSLDKLTQLVEKNDKSAIADYMCSGLVSIEHAIWCFYDQPQPSNALRDTELIFSTFEKISRINETNMAGTFEKIINSMSTSAFIRRMSHVRCINVFGAMVSEHQLVTRFLWIVVLASPAFSQPQFVNLVNASNNHADIHFCQELIASTPSSVLFRLVEHLQNQLTSLLYGVATEKDLSRTADLLKLLYQGNMANGRGVIPYKTFYNATAVELDQEAIIHDWEVMQENKSNPSKPPRFCFSRYPCLVDTKFKAFLMNIDGIIEQRRATNRALVGQIFSGARAVNESFLFLHIRRDRLIDSTLTEINRKSGSLKKPLKVQWLGEEGIDEGGPRKEFFQLLTKELLGPDYGMFYSTPENYLWLQPNPKCQQGNREFRLVGQILGLAVHNNIILDVSFPRPLYRKLLGFKLDFQDLKELDPSMVEGLEELLSFAEDEKNTVENVFCRNFTRDYEIFGEYKEIELIPGGATKPLTGANRQEFVEAMTQHVLHDVIADHFEAFREGFFQIADSALVSTMHPDELELLVCGNPVLDFHELEESTHYDGYNKDSSAIILFWKVIHSFDDVQKKLFLKFTTGTDRVPVGGLKDLNFVIGKNGDDSDLLPTSHTCFNHFLLPAYETAEKMKEKILLAISNCTGFGLK